MMKVANVEIPQAAIDAAIARMKKYSFTINTIDGEIYRIMGVSGNGSVSYRAADRLIQQQRKLGNIGPSDPSRSRSPYWKWIGG